MQSCRHCGHTNPLMAHRCGNCGNLHRVTPDSGAPLSPVKSSGDLFGASKSGGGSSTPSGSSKGPLDLLMSDSVDTGARPKSSPGPSLFGPSSPGLEGLNKEAPSNDESAKGDGRPLAPPTLKAPSFHTPPAAAVAKAPDEQSRQSQPSLRAVSLASSDSLEELSLDDVLAVVELEPEPEPGPEQEPESESAESESGPHTPSGSSSHRSVMDALRNDPLIGSVLGSYRITQKIGAGGFGSVYEAKQLHLDRHVAIKILSVNHHEPITVERFFREARAMGRLRHDNIVRIMDFGQIEGEAFYLVMELLRGPSLRDLLRSSESMVLPRIKHITRQLCAALDYIHEQQVYHRDLKPGNILLVEENNTREVVKLIDFGVASVSDEENALTRTGACLGSPSYMSPEQARGDTRLVDGRSDLYSLGVLLYQMLAGRPPFSAPNFAAMLSKHLFTTPPRLAEVVPQQMWAPELEDFLQRALAKEPDARPKDAGTFWYECKQALEEQEEFLGDGEGSTQIIQNPASVTDFRFSPMDPQLDSRDALLPSSSSEVEAPAVAALGPLHPLAPGAGPFLPKPATPPKPQEPETLDQSDPLDALEDLPTLVPAEQEPARRSLRPVVFSILGGGLLALAILWMISAPPSTKAAPKKAKKRKTVIIDPWPTARPMQPVRPLPRRQVAAKWKVVLKSQPTGATVLRGTTALGVTPLTLEIKPGEALHLTLRRKGHLLLPLQWSPKKDHDTHSVALKKKPTKKYTRKRIKKDIYGVDDPL